MATFTVSSAGGNWSSVATWVGGVLPAVGDDIVANATSGPLTVDSNRTCLTINFTNYTNTFTISNGVTLTVTGTAITLGSGMTYDATTTGILNTNANQATITITFAGITIHRLAVGHNSNSGPARSVVISGTTPTVRNFIFSTTSTGGQVALSGTALNITNSFLISGVTLGGILSGTTPLFSGTVTLSQTGGTGGRINCGFTVLTGSTLVIGSNITAFLSGTVTFQASSFLTPSTFTVTIGAGCTLNTNVVTWYNLEFNDLGTRTLTSDLNISNNFTFVLATNNTVITAASTRNINVSGSMTSNASYAQGPITCTNIVINLIGTGTYAVATITGATLNINSSNPSGYVLGNATYTGANDVRFAGTLNLVGTTVASAFATTPFRLSGTIDTNRSSTGGSNIIYPSITDMANTTFNSDTSVSGNVTINASGANSITLNGSKLLVGGNLTFTGIVTSVSGTSTIEFYSSTAASLTFVAGTTVTNNITVNKSGGATLSMLSSFTWGAAGRTLQRTAGNINPSTSTVTISNLATTISGMTFWNLTIPGGGSTTITQNTLNTIQNNLTLGSNGNVTFAGTAGWTCASLIMTAAGIRTITLQNGVTYTTTTAVQLTGATDTARYTMISDNVSFRAIWTVGNTATQAITYVNGTRIDSSLGATVWTLGTVSLVAPDTRNWNNGSQPSTVGYTFVN